MSINKRFAWLNWLVLLAVVLTACTGPETQAPIAQPTTAPAAAPTTAAPAAG